ncbi:MAG: ABC transporter ATP-binding protein [Clostridiales bacterium]|jgi:peptide/nickel transport system ATP-binding protein/oligopeptide transport system ATP-binding protein|nr:ABC transporter ATP-binding protein [Clostridiales bacterium]
MEEMHGTSASGESARSEKADADLAGGVKADGAYERVGTERSESAFGGSAFGGSARGAQGCLLDVRELSVVFESRKGSVFAVNKIDLRVGMGEIVCVVGESGCGKSVMMSAVLGLLDAPSAVISGSAAFDGRNLIGMPEKELRGIRGRHISMIFQEPMTCLNPVMRVGKQIAEVIRRHSRRSAREAASEAIRLLRLVGIPDAEERMRSYPHQLSGGMCQRVMIAIALACGPRLLFADEPTTALDVTIQAQILRLLRKIRDDLGTSILMVTHDLGVVAELAQRVVVLYGGRVVEEGETRAIFKNPLHPYTQGLVACVPTLSTTRDELRVIEGSVPEVDAFPTGCLFYPRCPRAEDRCGSVMPASVSLGGGHCVSCVKYM